VALPLDDQPDQAIALRARAVRGHVEQYHPRTPRSEFDEFPSPEDIERFSGVTVACQSCGALLHDDVAVCWQCGKAVGMDGSEVTLATARRHWWVTILTLVLVVAMVATLIAWEAS
jgi:hypothetical protein